MDCKKEYKAALELALSFRYTEAKERLERIIQEQPNNVETLNLLGKVEYYLRNFSASRRRFEAALTCDPENMTAYFGLEYYRERRKKGVFFIALLSCVFVLVSLGVLLYIATNSTVKKGLSRIEESLSAQTAGLRTEAEKNATAGREMQERILTGLQNTSEQLDSLASDLAEFKNSSEAEIDKVSRRISELSSLHEEFRRDMNQFQELFVELLKLIPLTR